jgi:hypothetical protein
LPTVRIQPRKWVRANPILVAIALSFVAAIMYLLQSNLAAWHQMQINQAAFEQRNLNAIQDHLYARYYRLTAVTRVTSIATKRLGMEPAAFNNAVWLAIRVPHKVPHMPLPPAVQTGPLVWMQHAVTVVRNSL